MRAVRDDFNDGGMKPNLNRHDGVTREPSLRYGPM